MKIAEVKVSIVEVEAPTGRGQNRKWQDILLEKLTDEGVTGNFFGWGDNPSGHVVADTIAGVLRPVLVGRDPFDRESIWHTMMGRAVTGKIPQAAVGTKDLAVLDKHGQAFWVPGPCSPSYIRFCSSVSFISSPCNALLTPETGPCSPAVFTIHSSTLSHLHQQ